MHLYKIKRGTRGRLIKMEDQSVKDWVVRTDLSFVETVTDPIKYHNGKVVDVKAMNDAAGAGMAVFGGEYGCENGQDYYLAVPYNQIEVL